MPPSWAKALPRTPPEPTRPAISPRGEPGPGLAGIYRPGSGTRFYLDGRFLGEIADPEFGRAFFAIWLDPRTSAPQLRASLLRPLN